MTETDMEELDQLVKKIILANNEEMFFQVEINGCELAMLVAVLKVMAGMKVGHEKREEMLKLREKLMNLPISRMR